MKKKIIIFKMDLAEYEEEQILEELSKYSYKILDEEEYEEE